MLSTADGYTDHRKPFVLYERNYIRFGSTGRIPNIPTRVAQHIPHDLRAEHMLLTGHGHNQRAPTRERDLDAHRLILGKFSRQFLQSAQTDGHCDEVGFLVFPSQPEPACRWGEEIQVQGVAIHAQAHELADIRQGFVVVPLP